MRIIQTNLFKEGGFFMERVISINTAKRKITVTTADGQFLESVSYENTSFELFWKKVFRFIKAEAAGQYSEKWINDVLNYEGGK